MNYSDGGGGSGSGDWGGDNDPPTQQEQKPTNPSTTNDNGYKIDEALSNVTKRKLEKNITENINGEILDRLKSRPINIKVIPDLSSGAGIYLPSSNTLILTDINDISTMREEFFHAYQNRVYTGGIDQYQHSAAGNIEFEAKLYCDLEDAFRNNDEPIGVFIYNWDAKSMQMYINCLQEATHGWNRDQPVDWDRIVREYAYFVHKFVEYGAGRYAGHSIGGVKLDAIKNIF